MSYCIHNGEGHEAKHRNEDEKIMSIKQQVLAEAKAKGIIVDELGGKYFTVELRAPDGKQFEEELHGLVSEGVNDNGESDSQKAWRMALQDVRTHSLKPCPVNCPCKET